MLSEDQKWFCVTLRFMGDNLPIDELQIKLNIEPSLIGCKDSHIRNKLNYAKYATNIWGWEYTIDSTIPFEEQLIGLLKELEPKKKVISQILSIPGVEGELFLGFSSESGQGGAYFSSDILSRISALRLAINLDLYPPNVENKEDI